MLIFAQRDKEKVDVKISRNRYINRLINDLIRLSEILSKRTKRRNFSILEDESNGILTDLNLGIWLSPPFLTVSLCWYIHIGSQQVVRKL